MGVAAGAFGDLEFDLREATTGQPRTVVTVLAAFGTVDVYVPEGINADVGELAILGHRRAGSCAWSSHGGWRQPRFARFLLTLPSLYDRVGGLWG